MAERLAIFRRRGDWSLADGDERHASAPDAFRVPTDEAKASVQVGDRVKLVFVPRDGTEERLWVRVTAVGDDELEGSLHHDATELRGLHAGDLVPFERRHMIAISRSQ